MRSNMMNQFPEIPVEQDVGGNVVEELEGQILAFVGDCSESIGSEERRIRDRFPIHCKLRLTPIDQNAIRLLDEVSIAFGKDLSRRGICFSHDFRIPHRRIVISITKEGTSDLNVEAEITWTRQTPIGLYESGCRLIRKVI